MALEARLPLATNRPRLHQEGQVCMKGPKARASDRLHDRVREHRGR
jgi:hypothetical protein